MFWEGLKAQAFTRTLTLPRQGGGEEVHIHVTRVRVVTFASRETGPIGVFSPMGGKRELALDRCCAPHNFPLPWREGIKGREAGLSHSRQGKSILLRRKHDSR